MKVGAKLIKALATLRTVRKTRALPTLKGPQIDLEQHLVLEMHYTDSALSLDYSDRNASVSRTVPFRAIATSPQKCVTSYSDP
jgi:hypothetical protein